MEHRELDEEAIATYARDGYVLVPELFDAREVRTMHSAMGDGQPIREDKTDRSGRAARLAIWFELGDDVWAAASRDPRIVGTASELLGEQAAFYHGKLSLKEARTGGAWEWHQDYGYWYENGFLFPHMLSAFVALDDATPENGCLQVLRGSHRLGRLEHGEVGAQTGADPERIGHIEGLFERVHVAMPAGSVLFFHCNLLHTSAPNDSDRHRRAFIVSYSAVGNPQLSDGELVRRPPCPVGGPEAILGPVSAP